MNNITPKMQLAQFAATASSPRITVQVKFNGFISLSVYDYSNGYNDLFADVSMHYDFTAEKCAKWIFAANQAIEQHLKNLNLETTV